MSQLTATALSVTAYATRIERAVRTAGSAIVEGEVQNKHGTPRGLLCFDLTDGESQLPCKVFPRDARLLKHAPEDGDLVTVVIHRTDYWKERARLTAVVSDVQLAGEGELLRRREALLATLRAEGLCDPDRFKPLPAFPRAVGVIAGDKSHGMADVIQALCDRFPPVQIVTCVSRVQGKRAPMELIDAIARLELHPRVDVVVIARGGGSVQDLVAFDDERLCRAISASSKPIVTAIGHTNNVPVCNHVTHAGYTPSRSAELVVPSEMELRQGIALARHAIDGIPTRIVVLSEAVALNGERLRGGDVVESRLLAVRNHTRTIARSEQAFFAGRERGLAAARTALAALRHCALSAALESERLIERQRGLLQLARARLDEVATAVREFNRHIGIGTRRQCDGHVRHYSHALARMVQETHSAVIRALAKEQHAIDRTSALLAERVMRGVEVSTHEWRHDMGGALDGMRARIGAKSAKEQVAIEAATGSVSRAATGTVAAAAQRLRFASKLIEARDYRRRGYVLATDDGGLPVRSVGALAPGVGLNLTFGDGYAHAVVDDVKEREWQT